MEHSIINIVIKIRINGGSSPGFNLALYALYHGLNVGQWYTGSQTAAWGHDVESRLGHTLSLLEAVIGGSLQ
jgi:hypothetical protein